MYFYNGLHGLYGFLVARGDDGRMQNNPNGRSRRGSKIRIIRAIRCGKTLPKLKIISNHTKLSYTMMSLLFAASGLFFLETN